MANPDVQPETDGHVRGEMVIEEHRATYRAFDGLIRFGSLALAAAILFLVLQFCTAVGFVGAIVPTLILLVIGGFVLKTAPASVDTL